MVKRRIRFALQMKDGIEVRTLQELKDAFDLNQILMYFADGKLEQWLNDRYCEEEADAVAALDKSDAHLNAKLCAIFGVPYEEEDSMSMEDVLERKERLEKLKQITDDEELWDKIDIVAFSQEELADLLDAGEKTIYLCGEDFRIPERIHNVTYIGIETELKIDAKKKQRYEQNGINLINLVHEVEDDKPNVLISANKGNEDESLDLCYEEWLYEFLQCIRS